VAEFARVLAGWQSHGFQDTMTLPGPPLVAVRALGRLAPPSWPVYATTRSPVRWTGKTPAAVATGVSVWSS
jgi:hypothetical protein